MAAPTLKARAHSGPSYTTLLDSTVEGDSVVGVSAAGELFLSRDSGRSWQPLPRVTGEPQALDAEPGLWHLATTHGIYRSTDEGRTWENLLA